MSGWLNRTTNKYIVRKDPTSMALAYPADMPFIDGVGNAQSNSAWIWNPDLLAVVPFHSKYWIITGDVVTLMNLAARDAVDAQEVSDRLDEEKTEAKITYDGEINITALALIIMDELNILRALHSLPDRAPAQIKAAYDNKVDTL